jgi:hypothetical protein
MLLLSEPYMNVRVGLEVSIDRLHSPRVTAAVHYDDRSTKYTFYEWDTRHIPDLNLLLNRLQSISSHVRRIIIKIVRQLCDLHRGGIDLIDLTRSHIKACSISQTVDKQLYNDIGKFYTFNIAQTVQRIVRERGVLEDTPM